MSQHSCFHQVGGLVGNPPAPAWPIVAGFPASHRDISRLPSEVPKKIMEDGETIIIRSEGAVVLIAPANFGGPTPGAGTWSGPDGDGNDQDMKAHVMTFSGGVPDPKLKQYGVGCCPAPFLKIREGATIRVILDNLDPHAGHSIDFHSVLGLKGGADILKAAPGKRTEVLLTFPNPGIFTYHCAGDGSGPYSMLEHFMMGMNGICMVVPKHTNPLATQGIWAKMQCAQEFCVTQIDLFLKDCEPEPGHESTTSGAPLKIYDGIAAISGTVPALSVFNGRVGSLIDNAIVACPNHDMIIYYCGMMAHHSSMHMIGGIWSEVYSGACRRAVAETQDTWACPTASATAFVVNKADHRQTSDNGFAVLVDHLVSYVARGALGVFVTQDPEDCEDEHCRRMAALKKKIWSRDVSDHLSRSIKLPSSISIEDYQKVLTTNIGNLGSSRCDCRGLAGKSGTNVNSVLAAVSSNVSKVKNGHSAVHTPNSVNAIHTGRAAGSQPLVPVSQRNVLSTLEKSMKNVDQLWKSKYPGYKIGY